MFLSKFPQLLRLISCLALIQVFAPALVAVADAWTGDAREAYAHIEAESGTTCVDVHHDDCALCSFIAVGAAPAATDSVSWLLSGHHIPPASDAWSTSQIESHAGRGPRAPPVS